MHSFSSPPVCLNSWEREREVLSTLLRFWCRTVPLLLLNAAFLLVELATRFFIFFTPPYLYSYFGYRSLLLSHAQIAFNYAPQSFIFSHFCLPYTFGLALFAQSSGLDVPFYSFFSSFFLGQL